MELISRGMTQQNVLYSFNMMVTVSIITTDRKPKELKEAIPELFPNYERVQELLHIRFDWFSNEIIEPYYHVAVLKNFRLSCFPRMSKNQRARRFVKLYRRLSF